MISTSVDEWKNCHIIPIHKQIADFLSNGVLYFVAQEHKNSLHDTYLKIDIMELPKSS